MTWIYFDEKDRSSPMRECKFRTPDGKNISLRQNYGDCNLVLYFAHSLDCAACKEVMWELLRHEREIFELDGCIFIILPEFPADNGAWPRVSARCTELLVDEGGRAKQEFTRELANVDESSAVLYILDEYQAPYAALAGDELDTTDLYTDIASWLSYIQIQCPE